MTKIVKGGKNVAVMISNVSIQGYFYLALRSLTLFLFNYTLYYSTKCYLLYFIYFIYISPMIRLVLSDGSNEAPFCLSMTSKMLVEGHFHDWKI
jgi:hypothetical protein